MTINWLRNQGNIICILFLLFHPPALFGQSNWEEGIIQKKDGTFENVQIEYLQWDKNPDQIKIRKGSGVSFLKSDEISGFTVHGEQYLSYKGEIVDRPLNSYDWKFDPTIVYQPYEGFLRFLTRDSLSLLQLKDAQGLDHFFVKISHGEPNELEFYVYGVKDDPQRKITVPRYKNQLNYLMMQCPSVQKKIISLDYKESDLVKVFSAYYKCMGRQPEVSYNKQEVDLVVDLLGGGIVSNYLFSSANAGFRYLVEAEYEHQFDPFFGTRISIFLPRSNRRYFIDGELSLFQLNQTGNTLYNLSSINDEYNIFLKGLQARLAVSLNRTFFMKENSWFSVGLGVANYFGKPDFEREWNRFDSSGELTLNERQNALEQDDMRSQLIEIFSSIRFNYGKIGVFAGIGFGNGFCKLASLEISAVRAQFGMTFSVLR